MPNRPGKYDNVCLKALFETEAHAVVLIVIGGKSGSGFSMNSLDPALSKKLPELLRNVADQIEGVS